uniref:Uncharacterized protein n=1 Tax=Solanum tuberosum TaxID=4113 RepID=M1DSU0_SOLTU
MTNDNKINDANTQTIVTQDVADKNEGLTPQETFTIEASEDDVKVLPEDVLLCREWVTKINTELDAVDIFDQHLEKVEGTLSVLEGCTLEEIESMKRVKESEVTWMSVHKLR